MVYKLVYCTEVYQHTDRTSPPRRGDILNSEEPGAERKLNRRFRHVTSRWSLLLFVGKQVCALQNPRVVSLQSSSQPLPQNLPHLRLLPINDHFVKLLDSSLSGRYSLVQIFEKSDTCSPFGRNVVQIVAKANR
jgi:hypothetical protein